MGIPRLGGIWGHAPLGTVYKKGIKYGAMWCSLNATKEKLKKSMLWLFYETKTTFPQP